MTVISTDQNEKNLTVTIVSEFDAAIDRVWQIWEDPRKLERWWGPPTWPATFDSYEFTPGGRALYYMTGPDGEKARGWWTLTAIDAPNRLEFDDGFADDKWDPVASLGTTRMAVHLEEVDGRTRMSINSTFESLDQMQKMVEMGMAEGMTLAIGQIDDILTGSSVS